jgi:hypothetical protein
MINWSYLVARFISAVASWLDASNLRNRVYALQQEAEIMETALDDIRRMDPEGHMGWVADNCLNTIREHRHR